MRCWSRTASSSPAHAELREFQFGWQKRLPCVMQYCLPMLAISVRAGLGRRHEQLYKSALARCTVTRCFGTHTGPHKTRAFGQMHSDALLCHTYWTFACIPWRGADCKVAHWVTNVFKKGFYSNSIMIGTRIDFRLNGIHLFQRGRWGGSMVG